MVIIILIQGVAAYHNVRTISDIQADAYEHRAQIKDIALRLAQVRLLVFRIIGTMNPSHMDTLRGHFQEEKAYLEGALHAEGIEPRTIEENFETYEKIIDLHYNFRVRTARHLINQESKGLHAALVSKLHGLSQIVKEESGRRIHTAYRRALFFTFGVLVSALVIAVLLALLLARTLTDRQQAERELQKSEEKYRLAMEANRDGLWDWDTVADDIYYSPGYLSMLGYGAVGVTDKAEFWMRHLHPEDKEKALKASQECIENRRDDFEIEFRMRTRDGDWRWILGRGKAVARDADGRATRMVGTHTDITERRHTEAALRDAHKMEAIGTLSGGIAHEFNNILSIMLGNTELALDTVSESDPVQEYLAEIIRAGLRAQEIVGQLLSFSRNTGEELASVEIGPVIAEAAKFIRSMTPANIEIKHDIQVRKTHIRANATQMNQMMINLCINAAQAMAEKGGTIEIHAFIAEIEKDAVLDGRHSNDRGRVVIQVRDNGSGIEAETLHRIFDPFFTTKSVGKGSGMGLAVVHGIVKSYDGEIAVESQPGSGTIFTVSFPVIDAVSEKVTSISETIVGGAENILVIDDEVSIVNVTRQTLTGLGYQVDVSINPMAALELFRSKPHFYHAVVTDMTMPRMTGVELSEKLLGVRPDIPIIICTGHSAFIDAERARELGIAAFVTKPVMKREIAAVLRKVLDATRKKAV